MQKIVNVKKILYLGFHRGSYIVKCNISVTKAVFSASLIYADLLLQKHFIINVENRLCFCVNSNAFIFLGFFDE